MKLFYYEEEIAERIADARNVVVFGAGTLAKTAAFCLASKPFNCSITAFLVSDKSANPDMVLGKKVYGVDDENSALREALVVVVAMEKHLSDICNLLEQNCFRNVIVAGFESDLWAGLRGNFIRAMFLEQGKEYRTLEESVRDVLCEEAKRVNLYSAKCVVDKPLKTSREYPWELQIQVGAELADKNISDIRDNLGDHISEKNRSFCELTALYWIWKNDYSDYVGLGHYRRHFELTEEMIRRLGVSDVDVVLTIPIINFPSVRDVYENDHIIEDWDTMLEVLCELHPEYYESAINLAKGNYYYAYNMFIARKDIFDEYCEWLFPMLFECEKRCKPREDKYQSRFIGFLAERLMSIFFMHNWSRWNIVHAKKNFLS